MYDKVGDPMYDAQCIQIRWGEEGVGEAFIYTYYPSGIRSHQGEPDYRDERG